ncbi:MAG: transglutaminaseTgpA domain-containing protein [Caldiserica bacterium]|nr:transglutaminaseTgpA domain-containing protein [Caldisericota bacterium]
MTRSLDVRRALGFLLGLTACGFLSIVETWYALYAVAFVVALPLAGHINGRWARRSLEALPLVWFVVLVVLGTPLFALLAQAMLAAMICRFILTDNVHDYQGLALMAVFVTVLSAAGSISVAFGLLLLVEFLVATILLIMAQFEGKVPHIGRGFYSAVVVSSLVSFVFAFGVFFALPRWTLGYIKGSPALATQATGFSKEVTITPGEVLQDNTVVMRVEPQKGGSRLPLPAYISGMRYTTFSGRQWLVAASRPESLYASSGIDSFVVSDQEPDTLTTVYLEPTGTDVLFGLEHVTGLRGQFQYLRRDAEGSLFTDAPYYKTIRYDVASLDRETLPVDSTMARRPALLERYLQVPELSQAFMDIAARVVRGSATADKARATRNYLLTNYDYSLNPTATSVEDFVVNQRTGYCEHFATSMVLLLRTEGVYARLVSGFVGTEWNNASGYLIVRAKDAHTWVEVLEGDNWVRYDPTPGSFQQVSLMTNILDNIRMAWYRNVVTYDLARQVQTANSLGHFFTGSGRAVATAFESFRKAASRLLRDWRVLAGLCVAIALAVLFLRRRAEDRRGRLASALEDLVGERRRPGETLLELVRRVAPFPDIENLVWQIYDVVFAGDRSVSDERTVLRLIRDTRRSRPTVRPQL